MRKAISIIAITCGLVLVGAPAATANRPSPPDWTAPAQPPTPQCGVTVPSDPDPMLNLFREPVCLDSVAHVYVQWLYDYIKALGVNENQWADFYEGYIGAQNEAIHFQRQRIRSLYARIHRQAQTITELREQLHSQS